MRHIIVAHRYEHATWYRRELYKELGGCIETTIVIDNTYALHGLVNVTVYVLNAPRHVMTPREEENRFYALQMLAQQSCRLTIKEVTLP
jgi:hypothetical protein